MMLMAVYVTLDSTQSSTLNISSTVKDSGSGGFPLCLGFLHLQDYLLTEEDEQLLFPRHVVSAFQELDIIEDLISVMFVRTQEIIISDPESHVIVGPVDMIKTIRLPIRSLIGLVQAFDDLFERTIRLGDSVIISEPDDLGDPEVEVFLRERPRFTWRVSQSLMTWE